MTRVARAVPMPRVWARVTRLPSSMHARMRPRNKAHSLLQHVVSESLLSARQRPAVSVILDLTKCHEETQSESPSQWVSFSWPSGQV